MLTTDCYLSSYYGAQLSSYELRQTSQWPNYGQLDDTLLRLI